MMFNGQRIEDLNPDQLDEAEAWLIEQIEATQAHYALLSLGYQEVAEARAGLDHHLH